MNKFGGKLPYFNDHLLSYGHSIPRFCSSHMFNSLLAVEEEKYGRVFLLLSLTAHVSLFPLLHQPAGKCYLLNLRTYNKVSRWRV